MRPPIDTYRMQLADLKARYAAVQQGLENAPTTPHSAVARSLNTSLKAAITIFEDAIEEFEERAALLTAEIDYVDSAMQDLQDKHEALKEELEAVSQTEKEAPNE